MAKEAEHDLNSRLEERMEELQKLQQKLEKAADDLGDTPRSCDGEFTCSLHLARSSSSFCAHVVSHVFLLKKFEEELDNAKEAEHDLNSRLEERMEELQKLQQLGPLLLELLRPRCVACFLLLGHVLLR
jgi:DNA repair exonuclease SbcCD ATPase subunit